MKIRLALVALLLPLALTSCERNFDELLLKARAAYAEKNYTVVIDSLTLALPRWKEKNGSDEKAEAYELLGKSYHALRKPDQATEAFRMAVKLSDKTYDSAYLLGIMYTAGYQHKNAQEAFQDALRMKKDDPLALVGLGDSLFQQGKYEEAQTIYKQVLAVSPGVPDALKNLEIVSKKIALSRVKPDRPHPRAVLKVSKKKKKR